MSGVSAADGHAEAFAGLFLRLRRSAERAGRLGFEVQLVDRHVSRFSTLSRSTFTGTGRARAGARHEAHQVVAVASPACR